jgi:hypothetical protein
MRTILIPAVLAGLLALLNSTPVHAYGAVNRSATYTNPYTGRTGTVNETTAYGPNGVAREGNISGVGPNGAYSATAVHGYSPSMYGSYSAVGTTNYYGNGSVVRNTTVYP